MDQRENEFMELLEETEAVLRKNPTAEQAIAVKTGKGNVYCFANHAIMSGEHDDENSFIGLLRDSEDTQVQYMVCKWNGQSVDVPSMHFRCRLIEINPDNENAEILLQGVGGYLVEYLKVTMPCEKNSTLHS